MSVVWVAFFCGLLLGCLLGVLFLALCVAAKRGDSLAPPVYSKEFIDRYCLKMFCEAGHEWYGECVPCVCPRCQRPAIGARS